MAKLIFLICILVALVHENVSEQSSESPITECKSCACRKRVENLPALSTFSSSYPRGNLAITICAMESYAIINNNITVNEENLTKYLSSHSDQRFVKLGPAIRNSTHAAVAAAQANDTIDDVYVDVMKRVLIVMESEKDE